MELKIRNFAKVNQADILIDGITVIAGENNTGKSTIGKILFSLFNSISGIDEKVVEQRKREIERSVVLTLRNYMMHNSSENLNTSDNFYISHITGRFITERLNNEEDFELDNNRFRTIISDSLLKALDKQDLSVGETEYINELVDLLVEKANPIINLSEKSIILELLTRRFNQIFNNQINCLTDKHSEAKVVLKVKNKPIEVIFEGNKCKKFENEISLLNKAIYIDNPYIVDSLDKREFINPMGDYLNPMDEYLRKLIVSDDNIDVMDGIIESVLVKEKLEEIYRALNCVVDGQIIEQNSNEFYLQKDGYKDPIHFGNLSNGLKAFVLVKMLLEKGILKEKDVLILDEPEIHLHPQWQVIYAEIIVLLQKHFDLSIIVTTHSPYFLDAINLYSIKHDIDKKVNYYLSSIDNYNVTMEFVTDNIDKIYKKMSTPVDELETLRYELNNR